MIQVGIIGMGRSGWELHAAHLKNDTRYRLVAVCDQSPARLADAVRCFGVPGHARAQDLIDEPNVDLVVVAATTNLHTEYAIAALEAGKHVVVEKPMAINIAEARSMQATAQRLERRLVVFHNRHWDKDCQMVK